ncbi:MAG: hypothetical protein V1765_00080 [bacterium]
MFLLTYSQDILYLVLAFCVLWLTVFLIWFVYYLIASIRQFYLVTKAVKKKVDEVDEIMQMLKNRIERSSSYLSIIVDGVKKMVDIFKNSDLAKTTKKKVVKAVKKFE